MNAKCPNMPRLRYENLQKAVGIPSISLLAVPDVMASSMYGRSDSYEDSASTSGDSVSVEYILEGPVEGCCNPHCSYSPRLGTVNDEFAWELPRYKCTRESCDSTLICRVCYERGRHRRHKQYLVDTTPRCRGKSVKFLESNPLQIVLCLLVLVDAGVVIAEILLDLHAIRGQFEQSQSELDHILDFIKDTHGHELGGYQGNDAIYILKLLRHYNPDNETDAGTRHRRHAEYTEMAEMLTMQMFPALYEAIEHVAHTKKDENNNGIYLPSTLVTPTDGGESTSYEGSATSVNTEGSYLTTSLRLLEENIRLRQDIAKLYDGITSGTSGVESDSVSAFVVSSQSGAESSSLYARERRETTDLENSNVHNTNVNSHVVSYAQRTLPTQEPVMHGGSHPDDPTENQHHNDTTDSSNGNHTQWHLDHPDNHGVGKHSKAEKLKEIAHYLHFCSIGILGIFVAQLFLKLYGMGIEFFRKRMEIFDAVIILASFALDLVFLEGIGGAQGEEAAALLIVFLLWRILRVINGIMVTAKKRQEFRIKLQKRARRRADKKIEILDEDKQLKDKEISALKELCSRLGAHEDDISACKPRRKSKGILSRLDTSVGLTSVASLSLSLSMSMSGGVLNMARSNPMLNRREGHMGPPRRTSGETSNHVRADRSPSAPRLQQAGRTPLSITPPPPPSAAPTGNTSPDTAPPGGEGNESPSQNSLRVVPVVNHSNPHGFSFVPMNNMVHGHKPPPHVTNPLHPSVPLHHSVPSLRSSMERDVIPEEDEDEETELLESHRNQDDSGQDNIETVNQSLTSIHSSSPTTPTSDTLFVKPQGIIKDGKSGGIRKAKSDRRRKPVTFDIENEVDSGPLSRRAVSSEMLNMPNGPTIRWSPLPTRTRDDILVRFHQGLKGSPPSDEQVQTTKL